MAFGEPILHEGSSWCYMRIYWQDQGRPYDVDWSTDGVKWNNGYFGDRNSFYMPGFGLNMRYLFRVRSYTDHWSAWSPGQAKVIDSEWGPIKSWNFDPNLQANIDTYGTYHPYKGETQIYKYFSGQKNRINLHSTKMKFSSASILKLMDYKEDNNWYFTWDQSVNNDYDTTLSAYVNAPPNFSNLPDNRVYDSDDDPEPEGNGYRDETEVTIDELAPYLLRTDKEYYVESFFTWTPRADKYATVESTAVMSKWGWAPFEWAYQTQTQSRRIASSQKYPWADWF